MRHETVKQNPKLNKNRVIIYYFGRGWDNFYHEGT